VWNHLWWHMVKSGSWYDNDDRVWCARAQRDCPLSLHTQCRVQATHKFTNPSSTSPITDQVHRMRSYDADVEYLHARNGRCVSATPAIFRAQPRGARGAIWR
jgi:hypothetical protein